jgi:hypothetical protein
MAALKHAAFNKKQSRQQAVADRACTCRVLVLLPYDNCPPMSEETGKMKQIYICGCVKGIGCRLTSKQIQTIGKHFSEEFCRLPTCDFSGDDGPVTCGSGRSRSYASSNISASDTRGSVGLGQQSQKKRL